jgi:hypothetical protein
MKQELDNRSGHPWNQTTISTKGDLMAADGTPDLFIKVVGEHLARIRAQRELSRAGLVERIHRNPRYELCRENVTEQSIKRLEEGRTVRVSRMLLEIICDELNCTTNQRVDVMIIADRSPVNAPDGMATKAGQRISHIAYHVHKEVMDMVEGARIQGFDLDKVSDDDLNQIIMTAFSCVLKKG